MGVHARERRTGAAGRASSSPRGGSSSTPDGPGPTPGPVRWSWPAWPRSSATTTSGSTTTSRRSPTAADPRLRGLHDAGRAVPAHQRGRSGPARHLLLLPQRRTAGQGGGVHRRLLGGRLILGLGAGWFHEEYARLRLRVPGRPGPPGRPRGDARGGAAAVDRGDRHLRRRASPLQRRLLRPQARPAAAPGAGRRGRGAGEPADRRPARRHDQLAGRPGGLRAQVGSPRRLLRGGGPVRSRPSSAPTARTAGSSTPRPRPGPGASRTGAGTCGAASRPTTTWPTTSWARSSRWWRRPRPSSTPGAAGSSSGSATTPATRRSAGSWTRWCRRCGWGSGHGTPPTPGARRMNQFGSDRIRISSTTSKPWAR